MATVGAPAVMPSARPCALSVPACSSCACAAASWSGVMNCRLVLTVSIPARSASGLPNSFSVSNWSAIFWSSGLTCSPAACSAAMELVYSSSCACPPRSSNSVMATSGSMAVNSSYSALI